LASNDDMFGIKIKISWTPQDLTKQIQDIQKYITANHKLNINLNLNENTLKGLERLSQLSKSAAKELNAIKAPMFNLDNPNQEAQKYIGTINNLVSTFQKFKGQTSVVYDEFGKVSLKVDTASGAIKRYTLQWDELTQRLSRTNMKNSDNSNVNIERELQLRQRLNAQIQSNADSLEHYLRIQQMNLNSSMSRFETQRTGLYNVDELNNLRTRLNQLTPTTENLRRNVGLLRAEFNSLNTTAIANGINTVNRNAMSLGESLKLVAFKMLTWLGMGNLIFGTISQIKSAVVFIKDLDSAMINLKKVTNETDMAYKEFESDSSNLGKSLARTTIEVIKATTNFAKMGYTLREAKELAKEALIMQNVGDIENVDKATQYLISTLKGFDLQVSESSKVIDIMNEVSNKHSISVDGLGSAYERSSAVMAQAGNTIEETTALLTAANAVVQNPEKVGNGFKTLALRLRGVDEESKDVFPKLEADLDAVGVQIRNVDGGFRSTYNILKDFSKVYMGMDDMSRSKLLEDMGGKYQANVLAATLQNFSEAEKTMGDALTSVGSSAKENEVYLTSVEAKVKQFQVSLEELYKLFFSSDLLKGGIGVLGGLVSLLNGVSSIFGGIPALAGASTTAILIFSSALRTSVYETIRLKVKQYGLLRSIPVLWLTATGGVRGFSGALAFLRAGLTSTRISVIALQATMTLGLSLAITGVITLVQKLVEHLGKSKESMEEQSQSFKDILSNLSNISTDYSKAKELVDAYGKLSGVTDKTVDQKQKIIEIQQQLAQLFPSLVSGYTLEGQAIINVDSKLSNFLDKKKEEIDLETNRLSSQFYQNQSTWIQSMVVSQTELNNLKKEQNDIQSNIDNVKTNTSMSEDVKESYLVGWYEKFDAVSEKISTTQSKLNEVKSTYDQGLTSTVKYELESLKLSNDVINNFSDNYLSLIETLKNGGNDPSVTLRGIFESIKKDTNIQNVFRNWTDAQNKYKEGTIKATEVEKLHKKAIDDLTESLKKSNPELKPEVIDSIAQSFILLGNTTSKVNNSILNISKTLDDVNESTEKYLDNSKDLASTVAKMNDGHKMTTEELYKLIKAHPELASAMVKENGLYTIQKSAIEKVMEANDKAFKKKIEQNKKELEDSENLLKKKLYFFGEEVGGLKSVAEMRAKSEEQFNGASSLADPETRAIRQKNSSILDEMQSIEDALKGIDVSKQITPKDLIASANPDLNKTSKEIFENVTGPYAELIRASAKQNGISATLLDALIKQESGFRAKIVSPSGAVGLTQLMPSTAKSFGVSNSYDPAQNIEGGAKYLKQQLDKFGGDISLALAAYNAGPGAVTKYGNKIPPYAETQNYVKTVLGDYNARKSNETAVAEIGDKKISDPSYTSPIDALIAEANAQSLLTAERNKSLQSEIDQAKSSKDYSLVLSKSTELMKNQSLELQQLSTARDKINALKDTSIATSPFGDTSRWYNDANEASTQYVSELNAQTAEVQKQMESTFTTMQKLRKGWQDNKKSADDLIISQKNLKQSLQDIISTQADEAVAAFKQSLENQKKLEDEAYDIKIKKMDTAHQKVLDNLDEELKAQEDSINAQIKAIDKLADAEDYNKNLKKSQGEAQGLQNQINYLSLDTSNEGKARTAELQAQLDEKNSSIDDMQSDHTNDLRKQNLQDQLDSIKKVFDAQKKSENDAYELKKQKYSDEKKIADDNYTAMMASEQTFADLRKAIIDGNIVDIQTALTKFSDDYTKDLTTKANQIDASFKNIIDTINQIKSASDSIPSLDGYANGTKSHPGGLAKISELGPELVTTPDGHSFLSGNNGPEIVNLPKDSEVLPADLTKKMLNKSSIPSYATGIGNISSNGILSDILSKVDISNLLNSVSLPSFSVPQFQAPQLANNISTSTTNNLNPVFNITVPKGTTRSQVKEIADGVFKEFSKMIKK